jgi:AraC family transcriptional regulator
MKEPHCFRAADTGEMLFYERASSKGRSWTGFECAIYDTSRGLVEVPMALSYTVSMHVGAPVFMSTRSDGSVRKRFQTAGDINVLPFGSSAAWEHDRATTILSMNLSPVFMRSVAESMALNLDQLRIEPELQLKDPRLQHLGWAVKAELEAIDPCGPQYAESLGTALAVHLLRRYAPQTAMPVDRGLSRRQLNRIIEFIQGNLSSDLTLAELSDMIGVSASHLKAKFKESTGLPVHQYIVKRRVDYAVELLSGGKRRLSEVALQAGFADQSHMARCMRRVIGMTPSNVIGRYS